MVLYRCGRIPTVHHDSDNNTEPTTTMISDTEPTARLSDYTAPTSLNADDVKRIVQDMLSSGAIEMSIDDSDLRKEIAGAAEGFARALGETRNDLIARNRNVIEQVNGELKKIPEFVEKVKSAVDTLGEGAKAGIAEAVKIAREAKEAAEAKTTAPTFNRAELKAEADAIFRSQWTAALAKDVKEGIKQPLPALLKVDAFFVENAQTKRIERALTQKRHLMASGPSGSGKTYPIEQVLRKHGRRYIKVSVADGLSFSDFIARANVRAGEKGTETYFTHGFLPVSMANGLALILDEIDQCQPEVVSIINAAMETGRIYIPQTGETVEAKEGWQVFMTCNTLRDTTGGYAGFRLNPALLNRLVFGKADYLQKAEEVGILMRAGIVERDATTLVGLIQGLRASYFSGKITQAPSTRLAVRIARCLLGQDDNGNKVDTPMKLREAFEYCFLDGLPEPEAKEAMEVLKAGI
jgi:hypothetical protein